MQKTQQENGRSFVETLSVLAIMGLLSVATLTGYKLAMNKHRANELLNDLMKRATVISAQRQLGQKPEGIGGDTIGGYPVKGIDFNNPEQFAITVEDVPQEVCKKILALNWDNATITPTECAEGNNEIEFAFNNDMSSVKKSPSDGGSSDGNEGDESEELPPVTTPVCDAEHLELCKNISDCEEKAQGKWCDGTFTCISGEVCQCSTEPNVCQKCDETGTIIANSDKNGEVCTTGKRCFDGNCSSLVYCRKTDSNAECIAYDECDEGKVHTGNEILNIPDAQATCGKEEVIYCRFTNSNGNCIEWQTCPSGRTHSGQEIKGVSNAAGMCAEEGASVYCMEFSRGSNKCGVWGSCSGQAVDATSSTIFGECLEQN